jgi:ABC-type transporter Mla subunit MlaD
VADAVTADVTALLSEVMLRRRTGELSGGLEGQGIMGAIEQLQVQVDGMRDQLRKSTGVLQTMDERMEVSDRRAVAAERIGASIEQEMQRLAMRIDEQVAVLAGSAAGGSELADGVARLTRKLRQSVAQLDRALVRLDEVVEHPATGPPPRPSVRSGFTGPGLVEETTSPPVRARRP